MSGYNLDALILGRALDAVEAIDRGDIDLIRSGAARRLAAEDVPSLVEELRALRHVVERVEDLAHDAEMVTGARTFGRALRSTLALDGHETRGGGSMSEDERVWAVRGSAGLA